MKLRPIPPCQVCQIKPSIAVASSVLGAISLAFCVECAVYYAEPYGLIKATVEMNGGWKRTADWVGELVTFVGQYVYAKDVIKDEDLDFTWLDDYSGDELL